MTDFKDIKLKDIVFERDFKKELGRELHKLNYAQAFMWLGIKFFNEKADKVTSQQLSNEVWGGKDDSYCLKILNRFVKLNVLKTEKKPGKKVRHFQPESLALFNEFLPIAMERIKEAKEDEKAKKEESNG